MFSSINLSPKQLAALTAFLLSVPIALGIWALEKNALVALASWVLIFLGSYALVTFTLEEFIYRKIKLIYKLIYQTRASKKEEMYYKYILPRKGIDDVREDVERWAEQRTKEIELLKQNEAYRREFLQNLSHEFKTPIFAIQGYIDTLLSGAMEEEALRVKFLTNASKNVTRLVTLINDMDEITKLESGEQTLQTENFVIHELIKEVFDSLSIKSNARNIKCVFKKGCESPIKVNADKEKISQVLVNLIDNAIKYGKEGGEIAAGIYITDEQRVLIEITDNGQGIEEEHLRRIFERFYRTDRGRSRDKGGSGLGLAICKHIIEAHQQTIVVRSKVDVGTTFGFTLAAAV